MSAHAGALDRAAGILALLGGIGLLAVGVRSGMGAADVASLLAIGAGTAFVAGGLAALLLARSRTRSLATQVAIAGVVPLTAALVATFLGARTMFFSSHDQLALVMLLLGAGTVALVTALVLGSRIVRSVERLVDAARAVGDGDLVDVAAPTYGSVELDTLAKALDESAHRLDEARRREQALDASRRELIAWVSHDLRTPLAGIQAIAEALEDGIADDPATVARYHATLGLEVERLGALVDDLFELSRAQSGALRLGWERCSLDDLVADAIAGVRPVAEAKGVVVEGRCTAGDLALHGSPPELLRVLRNILANAVRHTPADGSVVVEARVDGGQALVSVADTGGGIDEDHLHRIFEAGFRGDDARTPGTGGAGLGLAIADALVRAHHGEITVSNDGGGARFVVRLPVQRPTEVAAG